MTVEVRRRSLGLEARARVVTNMESSLEVPTATSVRSVPAKKLLIDNRVVINNHLKRARGGKVSFTHIIGYALVKALKFHAEMNVAFTEVDGKPVVVTPRTSTSASPSTWPKPDGTRSAARPVDQGAEHDGLRRVLGGLRGHRPQGPRPASSASRTSQGTTISLTNPGTIGTVHSVPRLMQGQGAIIGVGALEYPAEWQGASTRPSTERRRARSSR
jgi:2-oxoglutarate decarboxylase